MSARSESWSVSGEGLDGSIIEKGAVNSKVVQTSLSKFLRLPYSHVHEGTLSSPMALVLHLLRPGTFLIWHYISAGKGAPRKHVANRKATGRFLL